MKKTRINFTGFIFFIESIHAARLKVLNFYPINSPSIIRGSVGVAGVGGVLVDAPPSL